MWDLDGEGVVYDPTSGMGHVLNSTALQIWTLCDGAHSASDIEQSLADRYPEKRDLIRHDVQEAIQNLTNLGLLEAPA